MTIKTLIAATAIAALPMTASAAIYADDGTTMLGFGEDVTGTFLALSTGGAGDWRHTFELADEGTGTARVTIDAGLIGDFVGLVAQWLNAADNSVLASIVITDEITSLDTTFVDPGTLNQVLSLSWTDSPTKGQAGFDGRITVSTVPVPAGLLLMGTALAGLGMTRRFKA